MRPEQSGWHVANDILKYRFLKEKFYILVHISLNRQQAITWTNYGHDQWGHMTSLGHNELNIDVWESMCIIGLDDGLRPANHNLNK